MESSDLPKQIGSAAVDRAIGQMTTFDYTYIKAWESTLRICRRLLPFRKAFNGGFEFAKARSPIVGYNKPFLIWSAELGRTSKVGADVDAQYIFGMAATHYAVTNNNFEIVKLLVEKGANLSLRTMSNDTPLRLADTCGLTRHRSILGSCSR